jgi:gliding motility-associated lipoprotein GldH
MKKTRYTYFFYLIGLVLILSLQSCSDQVIYQKHKKIPDFIWQYDYRIPFNFTIKDTLSGYNTFLNVRNSSYYPYSNIWILVKKYNKNGSLLSEKKYEFILADADGRWRGDGLGDIIDNKFLLEQNIHFTEGGEYTYYFSHEMRTNDLVGLMDIGLSIEKSTE